MVAAPKAVLIETNFASLADAEQAGRALVEEGLAAGVNITPGMVSIYAWNGAVEQAAEVRLVAKTVPRLAEAAMSRLTALHPYETPAMLAIPVVTGSQAYFDWIERETTAEYGRADAKT